MVSSIELTEFREGHRVDPARTIGRAVYRRIMDDDALAIAGGMHIEFDHIGTPLFDSLLEGGDRILGGEFGAAPVRDEEGRFGSSRSEGRRVGNECR